jgi:hypothetical protein
MRELEQLRAQAEIDAMLPDGGDTHVALTLDGIDYPDRVSIFVLLLCRYRRVTKLTRCRAVVFLCRAQWEKQKGEYQTFDVKKGTEEWNEIENHFLGSLGGMCAVIAISCLWSASCSSPQLLCPGSRHRRSGHAHRTQPKQVAVDVLLPATTASRAEEQEGPQRKVSLPRLARRCLRDHPYASTPRLRVLEHGPGRVIHVQRSSVSPAPSPLCVLLQSRMALITAWRTWVARSAPESTSRHTPPPPRATSQAATPRRYAPAPSPLLPWQLIQTQLLRADAVLSGDPRLRRDGQGTFLMHTGCPLHHQDHLLTCLLSCA